MRRFVTVVLLVLWSIASLGQNHDASKYVNNPDTALSDARKALANGDYKQAVNLANLYNALTDSNKGDEIIRTAEQEGQRHEKCDAFLEAARQKHSAGKYAEAILNYLSAYEIIPEDKSIAEAIQKCTKDALAKKKDLGMHLQAAQKLWTFSSTQNDPTTAELAAYLGSEQAMRSVFDAALSKNELSKAKELAKLVLNYHGDASPIIRIGDLYAEKGKDDNTYSSRKSKYENAVDCYQCAADKGNAEAMYKLALLYSTSTPVKDLDKAFDYCSKAVASNYSGARDRLRIIQADRENAAEKRKKEPWKRFVRSFDADGTSSFGVAYTFTKHSGELSALGNVHYFSYRATVGGSDTPFVYECSSMNGGDIDYKWYRPGYHVMFAPGLFFNYFSFDLGLGAMFTPKVVSLSYTPNPSIQTRTTVTIKGEEKDIVVRDSAQMPFVHFMMQPRLNGFVPLFDERIAINAHVGYSYVPSLKEMCGIAFGFGLTFNLEY